MSDGKQTRLARDVWRLMFDILIGSSGRREQSLAKRGLTPNDSRALMSLRKDEGRPIGALASLWRCDPSTATWVVDRLEREGLAERHTSPTDRRVKMVVRTERGEKVASDLLAEFYEPPDFLFKLDTTELDALRTLLRKLGPPS
jgi:DNA-binding MarR family transcriptional regulator